MDSQQRSVVDNRELAVGKWGGFSFGGGHPTGVSREKPLPRETVYAGGQPAAILLTFDVEGNWGNGNGDEAKEIENYRRICEKLAARGIPATFHIVAKMAEHWGDEFISWMVNAGCEVASHGYVHDMNKRYGGDRVYAGYYGLPENREQVGDGIASLNRFLHTKNSPGVRGIRFPYAHFNEYSYEAAVEAGLSWASNLSIDEFGNVPFIMKLGGRVYDIVEIPLDSKTYDWAIWVADEKQNKPFVEGVQNYCTSRQIPFVRTPAGGVEIYRRRMLDTIESGGTFALLCHPINLTLRSEEWGDPVDEFLFPVIDTMAELRDEGKIWACTCSQLADFYRQR